MNESIGQIASGLNALMSQLDTVSNNIANSNTVGFKRSLTAITTDLQKQPGAIDVNEKLSASEVKSRQSIDLSQGTLLSTGRPLDVGLDGKGYLVLETPEGPLYTRNGSLQLNLLGQVTDLAGRIVAGQNGPITVPPNISELELLVGAEGTISAGGTELGKLKLADFGDQENLLMPAGLGAFTAPGDLKPADAKSLTIRQGYQEGSNVKIIQELVNMMSISRLYETGMNVLRRQRENSQTMLGVANG